VAHDVSASLASRNDDLSGYWTIGRLLARALATGDTRYEIDLVCGESRPSLKGSPLGTIPPAWAEVFWRNVGHQKLARARIGSATAILDFDLSKGRASVTHGAPEEYALTLRVEVTDDRGHAYSGAAEAWAFPHDPGVEFRSARRT
jgi:hypothetical protein